MSVYNTDQVCHCGLTGSLYNHSETEETEEDTSCYCARTVYTLKKKGCLLVFLCDIELWLFHFTKTATLLSFLFVQAFRTKLEAILRYST